MSAQRFTHDSGTVKIEKNGTGLYIFCRATSYIKELLATKHSALYYHYISIYTVAVFSWVFRNSSIYSSAKLLTLTQSTMIGGRKMLGVPHNISHLNQGASCVKVHKIDPF